MRYKSLLFTVFTVVLMTGHWARAQQTGWVRQIHLRFEPASHESPLQLLSKTRPSAHRISVIDQKVIRGTLPIQRNPQLSEDQLVIVALNAQGNEVTRLYHHDPRLIRAETADPDGKLTTENLYRESVEFVIALPRIPAIKSILILQPRWTGSEFQLDAIGKTDIE